MPTVTAPDHDFRHGSLPLRPDYGGIVGLRRISAETWAGIAMLAVLVGAASPVLLGLTGTTIPRGVWTALFVGMTVALSVSGAGVGGTVLNRVLFGAGILTSWVLLATVTGAPGFLPIVAVLVAAVSAYLVPQAVTALIVTVNTIVLALVAVAAGSTPGDVLLFTGLYLFLQVGVVMSSISILREQRLRAELTATNIELRAAGVLLEESARTAERLRISRDLHDSIGHRLTVLNLALEAARHGDPVSARNQIENASRVAHDVLDDLRDTVSSMRDETPDLAGALREMVDGTPDLEVSVAVDDSLRVDPDTHEVLVRAVQEIATNTLRHADARSLRIRVFRDEAGAFRLEAHDDGRGAADPTPGNGLRGMIERFDTLGGHVDLDGTAGFSVRATVPVP